MGFRLLKKDYKKRQKVQIYELKQLVLKAIVYNQNMSLTERLKAQTLLSSFPKKSYYTQIKNRCIITGKARGIYSKYKLSRIKLREFALNGSLPGVRKSSW